MRHKLNMWKTNVLGARQKMSHLYIIDQVTSGPSYNNADLQQIHTLNNPFDTSYSEEQKCYDRSVIQMLSNVLHHSMRQLQTPLITDIEKYKRNPNAWVVEQIVNGTAEISSTSLVLTPESEKDVRYSIAIGSFRPQIYYKAQSIRMASNIYFVPFAVDTWVALFCLLLIVTVVLTYILARESRLPHRTPFDLIARIADEKHDAGIDWDAIDPLSTSKETLKKREHWEIGEIILVTIGALCQQGSERDPNTAAARLLLIALFVLAVLIYTAFSASVISLISLLPNTDQEAYFGKLPPRNTQILLQDTNFFRYDLTVPQREFTFVTLQEGLEEALHGRAVFVADRDSALTTLHKLGFKADLRCGIGRAFLGLEYQRVFAINNNSSHQSMINFKILQFRQYGLLAREKKKFFINRRPCSPQERFTLSGFTSVDLSDIWPALQLIIWGWLISIFVIIGEYVIYVITFEIRSRFADDWASKENAAESILQQYLRRRLLNGFQQNRGMVSNDDGRTKREKPQPFLY